MKSRTEYVRSENLATARKEVAEYKKYKKLNERFIDLSIELSKAKIQHLKNQDN